MKTELDETAESATPWSFWAISVFALIWNVLGVANFVRQMDPESVATFPDFLRTLIENRPTWATRAFCVAVFSGAIGAALLLVRRHVAVPWLVISLAGVVLQLLPHLESIGTTIVTPTEITLVLMPLPIAAFLVWYARHAAWRGWLRRRSHE